MIEIKTIYHNIGKQGLGNRLFQYCWARQIAERKEFYFKTTPIPGFPETYNDIPGVKFFDNELVTPEATQIFDMEKIYNHLGKIIVSGYSQRYEHYSYNKKNIKNWMKIENENLFETPDEDDIIVNVRLGDYVNLGWDLPIEYYEEMLKQEDYKNAYIICDEPQNPKLNRLVSMGCIIKDNSNYEDNKYLADFVFAKNAKKLIIANSTFSWWAAFLSDAKVYYPCIKFPWYPNPSRDEVNLEVTDEDRYNFVYWE